MKKARKFKYGIFLGITAILSAGCMSLMENIGRMVDGTAFTEKTTALYRTSETDEGLFGMELSVVEKKSGEQAVIITIANFPMIKLRGSFPSEEGGFYLSSLEYLAGSIHGWNEYSLDLLAEGTLVFEQGAVLEITEEIETVQISSGRIQRYDTRLTGAEALTGLRNRRERVMALAQWMSSLEDAQKGLEIKEFEKYWKPVLFPELVSGRKRPSNWRQEGDQFIRAEDIRWNTGYTERTFSEELRPVRDSGTLLRDWEEALSWIYLEFEWGNIKENLSRQIFFQKIK